MKQLEQKYRCGECDGGIITVEHRIYAKSESMEIKKCPNCKKQYLIREFYKANLEFIKAA